jgi:hypothetical protein
VAGHARLTDDEAIADALSLAPGSEAVIEIDSAQPLTRHGQTYRMRLPAQVDAEVPRATLIDADDGPFLLLVPHRAAHRGTLVLRPAAGHAESLDLGALDPRQAVLVPLASRAQLDGLAQGAVELELADGHATWWTTLVAHRVGARAALQTRGAE